MNPEFKVGDRVRIVVPLTNENACKVGILGEIDAGSVTPYRVDFLPTHEFAWAKVIELATESTSNKQGRQSSQEGVIIISEDGEPAYMVRKNGSVKYYKLVEMGFGDHAEMLGADGVAQGHD